MTEPQKTEAEIKAETDAAAKATADKAAADKAAGDAGGNDRPSLERALSIQAEKKNAEIDALTKKLAARDAADLKAREGKMIEEGKTKELLAEKEKALAAALAEAETKDRKLLETNARDLLLDLGMNDSVYRIYHSERLPADATAESIKAWANTMKVDDPKAFTGPANPVKIPSTPDPAIDETGADLESRLKSDDNKVRAAAFNEQFKNDIGNLS